MELRGYAICTTQRSGSNFLGQLLESTRLLGRPKEYFNPGIRRNPGMEDHPRDSHGQLERITTRGATPNGVYGLKLFPGQARRAAVTHWANVLPGLKFIHLERQDVLGVALSHVRALQTDQYRSTRPVLGEAVYDRDKIYERLRDAVVSQACWRLYFSRNGISVLSLVYEDVVRAPQAAVDAVARLVGVDGAIIDPSVVDMRVQRDEVTDEWRERFMRETPSPHLVDQL